MRKIILLVFAFVGLAISSCKRLDGETVVEGQVVDGHTGEPIPNAIVGVYVNTSNAMWGGYTKDFEKQADEKGNFSFRFEGDGSKEYQLRASTSKGGSPFPNETVYLRQGRNNKNLKLKLQSPAWLKVKFINQLPKDTIWIYFTSFEVRDYNIHMLTRDTTVIGLFSGNETRQVQWEYISSKGQKVKESKQIYFPNSDTVSLEINY